MLRWIIFKNNEKKFWNFKTVFQRTSENTYIEYFLRKFESIANEILQKSYETDPNKAEINLMRPIAEFGNFTTIQAAVASKNLDFVAHISVQNVLARIWYSKMMTDTSDFLVWIIKYDF